MIRLCTDADYAHQLGAQGNKRVREQFDCTLYVNDIQLLMDGIRNRSHKKNVLHVITRLDPGGSSTNTIETAARLGAGRVVLIGEAAHVIPPIGAQGLNLGLRDAATIGELVVAAHRGGDDVGGLTDQYEHMRRADVTTRALAVDLLNRSLLSDFLPLQGARGLGFFLMERMGPLRRAIMHEGIAPSASKPRLMRGEAL